MVIVADIKCDIYLLAVLFTFEKKCLIVKLHLAVGAVLKSFQLYSCGTESGDMLYKRVVSVGDIIIIPSEFTRLCGNTVSGAAFDEETGKYMGTCDVCGETAVNENIKAIRFELGNRVRHQLRIVPEVRFYIDDSLDYIEHIDELLKDK